MTARTNPPLKAKILGTFPRSKKLADIISIEALKTKLDLSVLQRFRSRGIMFGVLDLGNTEIETPELFVERIRGALEVAPSNKLLVAPGCGMKYMPRGSVFAKLKSMVEGTRNVRNELGI